jgi:hypothetical protein
LYQFAPVVPKFGKRLGMLFIHPHYTKLQIQKLLL